MKNILEHIVESVELLPKESIESTIVPGGFGQDAVEAYLQKLDSKNGNDIKDKQPLPESAYKF
ncbi:Uncharacterised protein [Candidatus Tiddalikarchaeum anstoanum]|nr:Uncharacterised protein [Candidatus Tiddalikarchaeum anstoanum]